MHTASHGSEKHGPSLLETVAKHELALMDRLAETDRGGRQLVDEALAEASGYMTEDYAQLEREVADLRRAAGEARDAEVAQIVAARETKVAEIRSGAAASLDNAFREAVRRVLPRTQQ